MSSFRERNDPKRHSGKNRTQKFAGGAKPAAAPAGASAARPQKQQTHQRHKPSDDGWIWGVHAVEAALRNPRREGPVRLFLSEDRAKALAQPLLKRAGSGVNVLPSADIARLLPPGAVHQGMALNAPVLEGESLDALLEGYAEFRDFDPRELSLIGPLRIMRQVHWAGWVAARWEDPAFPRAFPQVGEARWWEQHLIDLAEAESALLDG